ncbi:MAG: DUF983 domain-containing protein [Hyphomicrobiaceae bacterium]
MSIKITSAGSALVDAPRNVLAAMLAGWSCRCPACGGGRLYRSYLKVLDNCPACGTALHHHRADDAPPYFTMFVVGHVLIGGVLSLEKAVQPAIWVHMALWIPLTILMSLWLLPRIKGVLIGQQWALRMHGFGDGPDPAAPDVLEPAGGTTGNRGSA